MSYDSRINEEGRALAYIGSLFFTASLAAFAGVAFLFRKMLRSVRESQAEGWQVTSAQVTSADVTVIHGRFLDYAIANVGYAYSISDAYYSVTSPTSFGTNSVRGHLRMNTAIVRS